ncbi:MAG: ABC transporter ATP-binding protein [Proteobacteria bacterium]|nr:ABC transporter ATP-binding protein [Pseudomonadota bacterium]
MEYKHIHQRFGRREILSDVSIQLKPGELLLLSGENGAGKSTLLRVMAGLLKPDAGELIDETGRRLISRSRKLLLEQVMYLHQTPYLFEGSVRKNLQYAQQKEAEEKRLQVDQALEWVGLSHLASENAKTLSGGERQRVALARALLRRPRYLLLDEPTAHLDAESNAQIAQLLGELKLRTVSMLIASHEPGHLDRLVDVEYRLDRGHLTNKLKR